VDEALEADHYESSAEVIVRRIDGGADIHGAVEAIEVVAGDGPDTLPVTFDNRGSCHPPFAPGRVVALPANTTGGTTVVEEASELSDDSVLAHLHGPLEPDPDADGVPAVVIAGRMPGADLAVLDQQLRVITTAVTGTAPWQVEVCDDRVAI